ncbi:hypothetical protein [Nocardioides marmorisolisilvae]|uniref:Uncharacterized protein n=1 Tax=Nocardioides marmorisolisilvae TaxID=1542737 RepID=A0A3N0DSR3_9ACTN|nr:hypothetical protein [Nocardioides marmorisolisilvae]RNL78433.1 hypothetical protein EFL95_04860 [Nocardioides marmorisolisilvae]
MKPGNVVDPVVDAAKHPLKTTAWAVGLMRGIAASVIRVAAGEKGPVIPGYLPGPLAAPVEENVAHEDVVHYDLIDPPEQATELAIDVEPAPEREPEPLRESFANEPTAVSRDSAHGGGGNDEQIDDWYGETDDADLPETVVEMLELGDEKPR